MRYGTGYVPAGHNLSLGIRLYSIFLTSPFFFVLCRAGGNIAVVVPLG